MRIKDLDGCRLLKDEENVFRNYIIFMEEAGQELEDHNLVLDLQEVEEIDLVELLTLLPYSDRQKQGGKSFVVIIKDVEIDEVPENLSIVPTLGEAEDLIQMEEIERDLGF